ncbi:hypothetical protein P153DRAFT_363521 [Dothidotthia symphoricarpi CBS 119687]|uniref:Uncharacterized protein n=1 Tax=Dothidotthia symphoricarpi CBS 119687 TaxID=1392245 RepID=A0A6A6AQ45_9PLEO|nr:uncharacterized protein P153DRAFT_363521 [Dothidotthia symphoricarpi CBS 119687]KAF2133323.1 hypothetical protein P153DRAFT_363521 [Dothidotthia symphoricarpi CBS 119687]
MPDQNSRPGWRTNKFMRQHHHQLQSLRMLNVQGEVSADVLSADDGSLQQGHNMHAADMQFVH